MLRCRTRRSTSPMETSPSTSGRRSSPATTSRPRSRLPFGAMSTSRKACGRGSTRSPFASGPAAGSKGALHRRPPGRVGRHDRPAASRPFRVYRGRTGKYVVYIERSPDFTMVDSEGKPAGWRANLGLDWNVSYGTTPGESTLEVVEIARRSARADPAAALRGGRALRQPARRSRISTSEHRRSPAPRRGVAAMTSRRIPAWPSTPSACASSYRHPGRA